MKRSRHAATLLAALSLLAGSARATGATGSISGHATTSAVAVCVLVLESTGQAVAIAPTNSAGNYRVDGIPAGAWTVEFYPDDGCLGAATDDALQFYKDAASPSTATPVTVAAGATTTGINATMAAAAFVKGSVQDPAGAPLAGVCVVLEDTAGRPITRQPTDSDGGYTIGQLPAGAFTLQFIDDGCVGRAPRYAPVYLGGSPTLAGATIVHLRAGQGSGGLDAVLATPAGGSGGGGSGGGSGGSGGGSTGTGGGGSSSGGGSAGGRPVSRPADRALLTLLGGRFSVDSHHRLHLRLRCADHGPWCRVLLTVRRVRRRGTRLVAGSALGSLRATIRPGRAATLRVRLRRVSSGPLWISAHTAGGSLQFQTVVSVRWPRVPGAARR